MAQNQSTNQYEGLTIVREFKAPRKLVFDAFANETAAAEWWGPAGMTTTVISFDFKKEGKFHYKMEGHGQTMWGLITYKKIQEPDLIEIIVAFSDEKGTICKAPFPIDFPMEVYYTIILKENNGTTTLTLKGKPINPTADQEAVYLGMIENMEQGFNGSFGQLDNYLKKHQ